MASTGCWGSLLDSLGFLTVGQGSLQDLGILGIFDFLRRALMEEDWPPSHFRLPASAAIFTKFYVKEEEGGGGGGGGGWWGRRKLLLTWQKCPAFSKLQHFVETSTNGTSPPTDASEIPLPFLVCKFQRQFPANFQSVSIELSNLVDFLGASLGRIQLELVHFEF